MRWRSCPVAASRTMVSPVLPSGCQVDSTRRPWPASIAFGTGAKRKSLLSVCSTSAPVVMSKVRNRHSDLARSNVSAAFGAAEKCWPQKFNLDGLVVYPALAGLRSEVRGRLGPVSRAVRTSAVVDPGSRMRNANGSGANKRGTARPRRCRQRAREPPDHAAFARDRRSCRTSELLAATALPIRIAMMSSCCRRVVLARNTSQIRLLPSGSNSIGCAL